MSSEALLENPALFTGKIYDLDFLAAEYVEMAKLYKPENSQIRGHIFKIMHVGNIHY